MESDTARGEKTNGRRAGAGDDEATPSGVRLLLPRGARCRRRRRESQEVEAGAAEARCGGIRVLEGEPAAAIAIGAVDGELGSRGLRVRGERDQRGERIEIVCH